MPLKHSGANSLMLRTLIILITFLVAPGWAQDDLPEDTGKPVTVRICTGCHGAEMFAGSHRSENDWDSVITTMTEKGLSINDADYATVLSYLSKNLGTAPRKININKATAAELQSALGLTSAQAEAVVAYRVKNGNFKDLDAVKKVEGLDTAALDVRKSNIEF